MEYRIEHDTMGEIKVPADRYWGAQTQRSFENFRIGAEKMPAEIIYALALIKQAAAEINLGLGKLDEERCEAISAAASDIVSGKLDSSFPLSVWQTGSGTQTNMNVNEVIANRACETLGKAILHPNDHVNMSQSSNDVFPSAMHIAFVMQTENALLPAALKLIKSFRRLERAYGNVVKTGRTHLQDAVPITLGQEISGWRSSLEQDANMIKASLKPLKQLAIGGTAVGTGLNAPEAFDKAVCTVLSDLTEIRFVPAKNKFHALSSKDETVFAHGALKALAADLMKIANDVRWLASGPRCGLGEITIPANEPGSSIMPGKVNPTQCEAVTLAAVQGMGNDAAIGFAASQGNFELNVFMPLIAYNYLQSVKLLADVMDSFEENCVRGIKANRQKCKENLDRSLMLVTALNPYIGYENAAKTAKFAYENDISLKEACVKLGFLSSERFDEVFHPEEMARKGKK